MWGSNPSGSLVDHTHQAAGQGGQLDHGLALTGLADDDHAAYLQKILNQNMTPVGNVLGGEDDLITFSLPANTLDTNGKGIRVTCWGTTAANANAKTLKFYFGIALLTVVFDVTGSPVISWKIVAEIVRTGANAQRYSVQAVHTNDGATPPVAVNQAQATSAQTDTAAITIKCTGTASATNDIIQSGMIVESIR